MSRAPAEAAGVAADEEVLIVGGGPVGLLLAVRLAALGVRPLVLERLTVPSGQARAIGIHPPTLERLAELELAGQFVTAGVPVRRGTARTARGILGELAFARLLPGPFAFVLSCPQDRSEALLERALQERVPGALRRGVRLTGLGVEQLGPTTQVRAEFVRADGSTGQVRGRYLVGCDGGDSLVRRLAGITAPGRTYDDSFVMGDFDDAGALGDEAVIFLGDGGMVESFPLPGGLRRWVARSARRVGGDAAEVERTLRALVAARTGRSLAPGPPRMLSAFGVERRLATTLVRGPLTLAGDAAHVISPIGGQGLNLGWLGAWQLAGALAVALRDPAAGARALADYDRQARRRARRAARRAEQSMAVGRGEGWLRLREAVVKLALSGPLVGLLARRFTMRGL